MKRTACSGNGQMFSLSVWEKHPMSTFLLELGTSLMPPGLPPGGSAFSPLSIPVTFACRLWAENVAGNEVEMGSWRGPRSPCWPCCLFLPPGDRHYLGTPHRTHLGTVSTGGKAPGDSVGSCHEDKACVRGLGSCHCVSLPSFLIL